MISRIEIVLATHNGEKYLPAFLHSLLAQTEKDWTILVRDDDSCDGTLSILKEFEARHPGKITFISDTDGNLGPKRNFDRVLSHSTADHVCFADQDDIWLPQKLETSLRKMHELQKEFGAAAPLLVHSDVSMHDETGKMVFASHNKHFKVEKEQATLSRFLVTGMTIGMTMMMNRPLVQAALPIPDQAIMHDSWVGLTAKTIGHVGYIPDAMVEYRRHCQTVTALSNDRLPKRTWGKIVEHEGSIAKIIHDRHESILQCVLKKIEEAKELKNRFGSKISAADMETLKNFIQLPSQKGIQRWETILRNGFVHPSLQRTAQFLLLG